MNEMSTADTLSRGQTLYAQTKASKTKNTLITKELVRPAGLEPAAFCSGEKRSMCMLFILQSAQHGCERQLRGVQRLLCTLLCTRSNPNKNPIYPFAAPAR